jgi:hypothetical protein
MLPLTASHPALCTPLIVPAPALIATTLVVSLR